MGSRLRRELGALRRRLERNRDRDHYRAPGRSEAIKTIEDLGDGWPAGKEAPQLDEQEDRQCNVSDQTLAKESRVVASECE